VAVNGGDNLTKLLAAIAAQAVSWDKAKNENEIGHDT